MKTATQIPAATIKAANALTRKLGHYTTHGWQASIPESGIPVVSDGCPRSYFKPGVRGWIIAGNERTVFLGSECTETILPEFTVLTEGGSQVVCQYGRDVVFAD